MRRYRNITDEELEHLGASREWDAAHARSLEPEGELLWVHNRRRKYTSLDMNDERLIRRVKVVKIDGYDITTDFGKYSLETGINVHDACGCMRFCDCYGRLYQLTPQD
jgi:hypothetical protein